MLNTQRVQNQALRFITNTSLTQRICFKTLHSTCNIEPLNQHIHRLAKKTRETMQYQSYTKLYIYEYPELYEQLVANTPAIPINSWFMRMSSTHKYKVNQLCALAWRSEILLPMA